MVGGVNEGIMYGQKRDSQAALLDKWMDGFIDSWMDEWMDDR